MRSFPTSFSYNFLIPANSNKHLNKLCQSDIDKDWTLFTDGIFAWTLQTYLMLRKCIIPVTYSCEPKTNCINVGHVAYLNTLNPRPDIFTVALQADYPRLSWAQIHIIQNQLQIKNKKTYWVPHWFQPGLIPRELARNEVMCVAYAGRLSMFAGKEEELVEELRKIGLEFRVLNKNNWNDFSEVDVLLAVRSFNKKIYRTKPPTKLFNAWFSEIPLIAGNDSAYSQVGIPGKDYIIATKKNDIIEAICKLKSDSTYYQEIVKNGKKCRRRYTRAEIKQMWIELLSTSVYNHYHDWISNGKKNYVEWQYKVMQDKIVRIFRGNAKKAIKNLLGQKLLDKIRMNFR